MTQAHLLDKYGPRLSMEQVAEVLGLHPVTVRKMFMNGELPIRTYKHGARRFASYQAVAEYLDSMDKAAQVKVA